MGTAMAIAQGPSQRFTLTPFTVFRVHPIESICYYTRGLFIFSIVAGIFIWLFKGKLTALEIMESML